MRTDYLLQEQLNLVLAGMTEGNALVARVMLHTGLRVGDVLAMRRDQLAPRFWVTEAKTGKRRQIGLPAGLRAEVLAASEGSEWAFPSPRDKTRPRTRQAVWKDLKRLQRALRLRVNVGTHSLRKEYAVELMKKYQDLERVRRALAHDSATTTLIYALADQLTATANRRSRGRSRKRKVN